MALGQDLAFKNPAEIVLAVALDHDNPGTARLVVYNAKTFAELVTVLNLTTAPTTKEATKDGDKGTGSGLAICELKTTTMGAPSTNGFQQTTIFGSANGGLTPTPVGPTFKLSATGLIGEIKGAIAGVPLDGIVVKGMFTASGKPIDHF